MKSPISLNIQKPFTRSNAVIVLLLIAAAVANCNGYTVEYHEAPHIDIDRVADTDPVLDTDAVDTDAANDTDDTDKAI